MFSLISAASDAGTLALAQGSSPDIPWLKIVLALVFCIALAVTAIGFVRLRYGMSFFPDSLTHPALQQKASGEDNRRLKITERLGTGPSSQFVILARGKQRYLLHVSPQNVTEIDRFEAGEEANDG